MNFLITGGLGYLGGRVVTAIAQQFPDSEVIYTHHKNPEKVHFPGVNNVRFKKLDLTGPGNFTDICSGISTVIHLAYPNEIVCQQDPVFAIDAGLKGTYHLLADAKKHNVSNFVFMSTGAIYGPLKGNVSEETLPKPESVYGITKKATEDLVLATRRETNINAMALRLSNGFGYPLNAEINRWTLLVNDLCRQSIVNRQMVLRSTGNQLRDFANFSDVIQAIIFLAQRTKAETLDGIFNLGSGQSQSVYNFALNIASIAEGILGYKIELLRPPVPQDEVISPMKYDISKLLSLGFKPQGNVNLEIEETLRFCKVHFGQVGN